MNEQILGNARRAERGMPVLHLLSVRDLTVA